MALAIFRDILCCCWSHNQSDERDIYDERRHLIVPEINADDTRMVQKKIRERLTEIVRSKEVKMVNVGSQIPFNLHNQVIPKAQSHSSSRSGSESFDRYYGHAYYSYSDFHSNQDIERSRKQRSEYDHGLGRVRSVSPSYNVEAGPSARPRSLPPAAEQPSAARLLNIRLVGYDDTRVRGRTRERGAHPTGFPGLRRPANDSENVEGNEVPTTPSAEEHSMARKTYDLDLPDPNAMIMTWGD